ncbi:MAG: hypothetical protein RL101_455 [Actinomycetota bacterium]|jgi:hypothetical protein
MKKIASVLVATAIALSLSGCALLYPNWGTDQNPGTSQSAEPTDIPSESTSASPSAVPKSKANVQISDAYADAAAGVLSVVAAVSNVTQDGGTCTLILQNGNTTKRLPFKAEANVNSTQCHPMDVPLAGLVKGTAIVSVEYDSPTYFGVSATQSVVIP